MLGSPSGGDVGTPASLFTLPVTLVNVIAVPGINEMPVTRTGDSAGALSPMQQVEPFGIPARKGLEVPGTTTPAFAEGGNTSMPNPVAIIRDPINDVSLTPITCAISFSLNFRSYISPQFLNLSLAVSSRKPRNCARTTSDGA